jgi:hypothetical protein
MMVRLAQRLLLLAGLVVMTSALPDDLLAPPSAGPPGSPHSRSALSRLGLLARLRRVEMLQSVFLSGQQQWREAVRGASCDEERERLLADDPRRPVARMLLGAAAERPDDPAALNAAQFLASVADDMPEAEAARRLLLEHHAANPSLGGVLGRLERRHTPAAEALLRKVAADHPSAEIRTRAAYSLGVFLLGRVEAGESPAPDGDRAEARTLLERVEAEGVGVPDHGGTLAEAARASLLKLDGLTIGQSRPSEGDLPGSPSDLRRRPASPASA